MSATDNGGSAWDQLRRYIKQGRRAEALGALDELRERLVRTDGGEIVHDDERDHVPSGEDDPLYERDPDRCIEPRCIPLDAGETVYVLQTPNNEDGRWISTEAKNCEEIRP